jgi:hypothetical protein
MRDPKIVCILGSHRSGTSVITRVLNLLGLYLGPEENMRKPRKWNPRGYWEHQPIIDLNDAILTRLGGSWHDPPSFPLHWETSSVLEDLRPVARNYLQENFSGAPLWGWKEPRTCLTLPFWQKLLPPLSYLVCLRSPLEVAQSLKRRNRYSLQKGVSLWVTYLEHALHNTVGSERRFLFFEDFMNDWRSELQSLSRFLGRSDTVEKSIEASISEFIDPALRHHDVSFQNVNQDETLEQRSESVKVAHLLYTEIRGNSKNHPDQLSEMLLKTFQKIKPELEKELPWQ